MAVEPPDGACFATAAYRAGDVDAHRLAFVVDVSRLPGDDAHTLSETTAHRYMRTELPRITTKPFETGAAVAVLGVAYADSPLLEADASRAAAGEPQPLSAVAVAVTGVVTIMDEAFKANKKDFTAGSRLHVKADVAASRVLFAASKETVPKPGWQNVGLVLEVGAQGDARVLLTL